MQKLQPINDRLLIRPLKDEEEGGIIIPSSATDSQRHGEVIATGRGMDSTYTHKPMGMQPAVGDIIVYSPIAVREVTVNNEILDIIDEKCIFGILTEEE